MVTQTEAAARLLGALLMAAMLVGVAQAADWTRYRPGRLKDIPASPVPAERTLVLTEIPIRARVQYTGDFRPLPDDARRHIAAWAEATSVTEAPLAFRREAKVVEDGVEYWLPVQEVLVRAMKAELTPGHAIDVFVIHIGQSSGRLMSLINEFTHEGKHGASP